MSQAAGDTPIHTDPTREASPNQTVERSRVTPPRVDCENRSVDVVNSSVSPCVDDQHQTEVMAVRERKDEEPMKQGKRRRTGQEP